MTRFACFATLFITACTSEPDLVDEIVQDLEPTPPSYIAAEADDPDAPTIDELVAQYCPGITYGTGIPTYKGISGTYARIGLTEISEPVKITFRAEQDHPDARGAFTGIRTGDSGQPESYAGRFAALPDNPAIGPALALDVGADGEFDHVYFVLGIRRSFGLVRALCLGGAERPFLLQRATLF